LVTWALGHLVHFVEPDDHGPPWSGRWSSDPLRMVPEQWRLKTARSTVRQFQVLKRLIIDVETEQPIMLVGPRCLFLCDRSPAACFCLA
jgi:DNA topoisomerase-3